MQRLFPAEFREYCDEGSAVLSPLSIRSKASFSLKQYLANREYNTALGFAAMLACLHRSNGG